MKFIAIAICVALGCLFAMPNFIPQLNHHVFNLGELNVKASHCLTAVMLYLVYKGGK